MTLVAVLSLLAAAGTAYTLARPHLALESGPKPDLAEGPVVLQERRERCLQVLKDLELDYHTQKISEADYRAMKLTTSQELATILKAIDEHGQARS